MKNLKKALMALVLVALLVSSVVTIAIADASYSGTVEEAQKKLDAVYAETAESDLIQDHADAKAPVLKTLYEYLVTVDPQSPGYDAVREAYNSMTFKVMYTYFEEYAQATTDDARTAALAKVYTYKKDTPVIGDDDDVSFVYGFVCTNCQEYRDFATHEFFDGLAAEGLRCPGKCTEQTQKLAYITDPEKTVSYVEFEKQFNSAALANVEIIVEQLFSLEGMSAADKSKYATYYDYLEACKEIDDILEKIVEKEYESSANTALYTGSVSNASSKIASVTVKSDYERIKTALGSAYRYLVKNPVDPTSDDFFTFITKYNDLCKALVSGLEAKVNACATPDAKVAELVNFRAYLAENQISEYVVNKFNELRTRIVNEHGNAQTIIESLSAIDAAVFKPVYSDALDDFAAKLDAAEAALAADEDISALVVELYSSCASAFAYNPEADSYADLVGRYLAICDAYVKDAFVAPFDSAKLVSAKFDVLVEFNGFVSATPLSERVINKYNEIRAALIEKLTALDEMIADDKLPAYEAPVVEPTMASKDILASFIETLTDSTDRYSTAEGENKLAALEDMKKAAAGIRKYILGMNIDGSEEFYAEFAAAYNAAREKAFDALIAAVDAAEGEAVIGTLEKVGEFLAEVPLTREAIDAYNAKVDELVTDADKAAALKVSSEYDEIDALISAVMATEDVAQLRELGKKLFAKSKNSFDITDSAYTDYLASNNTAMEKIAGAIYADIIASLNASDASEDAALVAEYLKYASDVYVESVVTKTADALKFVKDAFASVNKEITETNANAGKIDSDYEAVDLIINKFDSADSLTERAEAFAELFDAIWKDCFTTAFISGESYSEIMSKYERVRLALETELTASLEADVSAYTLAMNLEFVRGFVSELPFSKNVIDAYNATYAEISASDLGALVEEANTACPAMTYVTPNNWNSDLSLINSAIANSFDEYDQIVEQEFKGAYGILAGKTSDAEAQVVDFGVAGFYDTVRAFDNIKQSLFNAYENEFRWTYDDEEKIPILESLGADIDRYPFSEKLVDMYNENRQEIRDSYSELSNEILDRFQVLLNKFHERIKACEIDADYLSEFDKKAYDAAQKLIAAAEFAVVDKYIEAYFELTATFTGEHALIYKNYEADKLYADLESFTFGDTSDAILAKANLELAFAGFIRKFDAELAGCSDAEKAEKIERVGNSIMLKKFPSYLIDLYNARYGTNLKALSVEDPAIPASMLDYGKLLGKVMVSNSADDARYAIIPLVEYVNGHKFSTDKKEVKVDDVKKALEEETAAQIEALDKRVDAKEAELAPEVYYDFDTAATGGNYKFAIYGVHAFAEAKIEDVLSSTDNKYLRMTSYSADELTRDTTQYLVNVPSAEKGIVLDFDLMLSKTEIIDLLPFQTDGFNFRMYFYGDKGLHVPFNFVNGVMDVSEYDNLPEGMKEITVVPDQWIHITIAIDHKRGTQELYVDYVSLGKIDINVPVERLQGLAGPLRMCTNNTTACLDNLKIYQGTTYRTLSTDSDVSDADKFGIYMDTLLDAEANVTDRLAAYYSAQSLKSIVAGECADLVEALDEFTKTEFPYVKSDAEAEHLKKLQELVNKALESEKQIDISTANDYIETNRLYMDMTNPEFRYCTQALIDVADKITWIDNVKQYISITANFHRATSYASLTRHLESVTYYYNLCELYDADKMADALKLAEATDFTKQMKADASAVALVPDVSFANYYTEYVPARLASQLLYENSKTAVDCVAFIDSLVENREELTPDAYKAALLAAASAEENFDLVDSYLAIVRKVITSGDYDEDYEGFDHVLEVYKILNPMFFDAVQQNHFVHIEEQLDNYTKTNSYIERAGICTYIRNYIKENDVDMSSEKGRQLLYSLDVFEGDLVGYKVQYEAILAANTESFIGMVKKMQAYVTYSELKPLYEETMDKYYYSMNVDSEEVQAAIKIFDEYAKKIKDWEENSAMLLVYANDLKSTRTAQKFRALVRCSNYASGADAAVSEEVAAAINLYVKAYSEYMEMIEPTINATADATNVANALRTNRISANVLAMANAIINK